jgi:uncharacterized membrane protein YdbT with pleckstrin-like domain
MSDALARSRAASLVERVLRIPAEPAPPAGAHESVRTFRAARGFYRYQLLRWAAAQAAAVTGLGIAFVILRVIPDFPYKFVLDAVEIVSLLAYLCTITFTYLMVHLDYQLRWYIVTDRSLRIREGLLRIDEKTMSFANIQNVSVRQGPLQRAFGIADVEVRTAGGGGSSGTGAETGMADMHLGYFRGVDNAEEIRDAVLVRVRELRDAGLGDPDAAPASAAPASAAPDALAAARELLDEARRLRALATTRGVRDPA